MREIKFRGKDLRGQWQYGDLIHNDETDLLIRQGCINSFIKNETAGQFTGQKDKNGKEIYEGDIVNITISNLNYLGKEYKSSVYKCICIYLEDEARFVLKNTKTDYKKKNKNWRHKSMVHIDIIKKEVIGNIHDNPELLKGGAK